MALVAVLPLLAAAARLLEAQLARRVDAVSLRADAYGVVLASVSLMRADPTPGASSYHDPLFVRPPAGTTITPVEPPLDRRGGTDTRRGRVQAGAGGEVSSYPFFNVNIAPAHRLEQVAATRLPEDVSPIRVLSAVRAARERGEPLTPATLRRALGAAYNMLRPVITAQPLLNANTVSQRRLERLLRRHFRSYRAAAVASRLLAARAADEIDAGQLPDLLGVPADAPVLTEIGVRSHLVHLRIRRGGRRYEALIARLPGPGGPPVIRVLRFAEVSP